MSLTQVTGPGHPLSLGNSKGAWAYVKKGTVLTTPTALQLPLKGSEPFQRVFVLLKLRLNPWEN
jgi:hypothetical protein